MHAKRFRLAPAALSAGLAVLGAAGPAGAEPSIDGDTAAVLTAMQDYLGGLEGFSVRYDADFDVITATGQKLKFLSSGDMAIERPGHMHMTREGSIANADLILDGETLTLHGRNANVYFQVPVTTIDEAVDVVRDEMGFPAPGADLVISKPFAPEMTDIVTGTHVGMTTIGGETVHHLAFQGEQADWQLWVKEGDQPLPVRFVITSKWMTGAPEYSLRLSDWNVETPSDPGLFSFSPPDGAKQLTSISVDETGAILQSQE